MTERKRVIIVYNPRASQAKKVEEEILRPLREEAGILLGKFEIDKRKVEENATKLARILQDGDVVIAVGGDGAVVVTVNGCMLARKRVKFTVLPYGNFNDVARSLGSKRGERGLKEILQRMKTGSEQKIYPLEVKINGKFWRYGVCYVTMGLLARSTMVFDGGEARKKLRKQRSSLIFSLRILMWWYLKNRKRSCLNDMSVNGRFAGRKATDLIVLNGKTAGKIMKGGDFLFKEKKFLMGVESIGSIIGLAKFMWRAVFWRVPGEMMDDLKVEFEETREIAIQSEGECQILTGVKTIEIRKSETGLQIV